jgi:hypothetical protein
MFKHILATATALLFFGGTVSTAKAPPPKPIKVVQAVEYQLREAIPNREYQNRLYQPKHANQNGGR